MLSLNFGVMLIIAGIFFVTMILLKMWLFDPLVKFMDEREETLKKELQMISENTEETQKIEEDIKTILKLARDDAKKILEEARIKAIEEAERIKALKRKELEEAKESLFLTFKQEKEKILNELLQEKESIKMLIEKRIRDVA